MTTINVRLPESLLNDIDQTAEEIYTSRSAFIRAACCRHIHIIRHVELPAMREHYRNQIPKTLLEPEGEKP